MPDRLIRWVVSSDRGEVACLCEFNGCATREQLFAQIKQTTSYSLTFSGKVSTHFCELLGGEENWRQPDAQHVQGLSALGIGSALHGTRTTGLFLP